MIAVVAAKLPGLGDPMKLPVDLFFGSICAYAEMMRRENAPTDARSHVEEQMRRAGYE